MKLAQWINRARNFDRNRIADAARGRRTEKRKNSRVGPIEALEPRLVMDGGFSNAAIGDLQMQGIADGLDGFAAFGRNVSGSDAFAEPFALFQNVDGTPLTIGGLLNVGNVVQEKLADPVRTYLQGLAPAARNTDGLVSFLDSISEVTAVTGGSTTDPTDELRFEVQFSDEASISTLGLAFGSHGDALGLVANDNIAGEIRVMLTMRFAFGVDLNSELNTEQAFFVRDSLIEVIAVSHEVGSPFDLSIGFLDATASSIAIDLDWAADVTINNVVPDPYGNITLSELNGNVYEDMTDSDIVSNVMSASIVVPVSIGSWTAPGSPTISVSGLAVGDTNPNVTTNGDFAELLNFNNVDAEQVVAALDLVETWLVGFGNSSVVSHTLPFVDGVIGPRSMSGSSDLWGWLKDATGHATFGSAQEFAANPGVDLDYDPVGHRLVFSISEQSSPQVSTAPFGLGDSTLPLHERCVGVLCGLESSSLATLTSRLAVDFDLGIDLSGSGQPVEEQFSTNNFEVRGTVLESGANLSGSARYGMVGIDFANGSYSGSSRYVADIVDPVHGDSEASLAELLGGLATPDSLLGQALTRNGTSLLELNDLSVQEALFGLPAGAELALSVADFSQSDVTDLEETGIGVLENLKNVTQAYVIDSIVSGITGVVGWADTNIDALETIGVGMQDLVQTVILDTAADAIQGAFDAYEAANGVAARLQDVGEVVTDFVTDSVTDAVGSATDFVANVAVDAIDATVDITIDMVTSTVDQAVAFGLSTAELALKTGDAMITGVGEFAGSGASLAASVWLDLSLDLQLDVADPDVPLAYALTTSALTANVYINEPAGGAPALEAEGTIGVLGIGLDDGSVVVAASRTSPNPTAPATLTVGLDDNVPGGRQPIDQIGQAPRQTSATGQMDFDFQVTPLPGATPDPNRFHFRINNLNNTNASTAFVVTPPNFPALIAGVDLGTELDGFPDALDDLLAGLESAMQFQVFGFEFPIIGDALDGPANFLHDLRVQIDAKLDGLGSFDTAAIEGAIEDAIDVIFGQPAGDTVHVVIPSIDEIQFTLSFAGAPIEKNVVVDTDLGFPALGASFDATLDVVGSYNLTLTIGVSRNDGIYIDTSNELITSGLDIDVNGSLEGRLGFIQVTATADTSQSTCTTDLGQRTAMHLGFGVGLTDPTGDGKLAVADIHGGGNLIDSSTGVTGCADIDIDIEASVNDWLPSIATTLQIDWDFDMADVSGGGSPNLPSITYDDVILHLGSFFDNVIGPYLETVEAIINPIEPALDLLTTPLPLISDLVGDVTLLSIAEGFADLLPNDSPFAQRLDSLTSFLEILITINDLANAAGTGAGEINFGDLSFGNLPGGSFDARRVDQILDLAAQVDLNDINQRQQFDAAAPDFASEVNTVNVSSGSLSFPIFENPLSVFEWLLGFGQVEIVTWELPSISVDIPIDLTFPIIPGILKAGLLGSVEAQIGLTVGVDTLGFSEFFKTGDVADLFKGFYVSDTDHADGSGTDIPEASITGTALAGVGVGFDIGGVGLEATVGGGIEAEIDVDLLDHDGDGKLRGHEFLAPEGCMSITGTISVVLEASALIGPFRHDFPFARKTLGGFNEVVECPQFGGGDEGEKIANLVEASHTLNLFVGDKANKRTVQQDQENEVYEVTQEGDNIVVSAFGVKQTFLASSVHLIVADAGTGTDRITIDSSVNVPVHLFGGDGDDLLIGGSGSDIIDGGSGNNDIDGQAGCDLITTLDGNDIVLGGDESGPCDATHLGDTIDTGLGDDEIHGGLGDDSIVAGDGLNLVYGDGGNDTVTGGLNRDVIYGGTEDDDLSGLEDADVIIGEDGNDTVSGGDGADVVDGGAGIDSITGDDGNDALYGGDDGDDIDGGNGRDYIDGGLGGDTLRGGIGVDSIHGGDDGDSLFGNEGDDLLFGEAGGDDIKGQIGLDTIEGGTENDTIDGGQGDDLIHGNEGGDDIEGGLGNDLLYGDDGQDTIHGYDGSHQTGDDCDVELAPDRDSIYGGLHGDDITGDCDADLIYGEDGFDDIQGNGGDDVIDGGIGNDDITGDDGFDNIQGGDGNDTIEAGEQADTARGGQGNDSIYGQGGEDLLYGDSGDDWVDGGLAADLIDGGADNDHLLGQEGQDEIFGNVGADIIEGNGAADILRGNVGGDLIYGDDGNDDIAGGPDNDTIRGGEDDDTARGGAGDDLMLGHTGNDVLYGDAGNDVLYGYLGDDILNGGTGNDRALGQLGDDQLNGEDGDDTLEGGPGDDTATGGIGRDALYGEGGVDDLTGGPEDDYINAGNGIGDLLKGEDGNDTIIGSDDGTDDPDLKDTVFFGDVIDGGPGDDTIESLGGADVIDAGLGNDIIKSGTHGDRIVAGPALLVINETDNDVIYAQLGDDEVEAGAGDDFIEGGDGINTIDGGTGVNTINPPTDDPIPAFALSTGPDVAGHWAEISGSASLGGLTQVGGFEESIFAVDDGVYVVWVDSRNGNSEIYLAYHADGSGDWVEVDGSASGGGISDDSEQSRRPTVVRIENVDANGNPVTELLVAWTMIDSAGASSIQVMRFSDPATGWEPVAAPGQTGTADNPRLVPFSDDSALLGWVDSATGLNHVYVSQYIFEPTCYRGFRVGLGGIVAADVTQQIRATANVAKFDIAAVEFRAAMAASYGSAGDHDVDVAVAQRGVPLDETTLCPGANTTVFVETTGGWFLTGTFTDGDAVDPAVGMRLVDKRSQGQNEVQIATDTYVAWQRTTDREDQVVGMVSRQEFTGAPLPWEELVPRYRADQAIRVDTTSMSDTVGYAAKPDIATSSSYVYLAWMDDGVHHGGDGRTSIFVMTGTGTSRTFVERLAHDASGSGISATGGALESLSISTEPEGLDSSSPYVAWTDDNIEDHADMIGMSEVAVRRDLGDAEFAVRVRQSGGTTVTVEGGASDNYSVVLLGEPAGNVQVTLHPTSQVTVNPATLIFTPTNWFTPQIVTISAVDDSTIEGQHTGVVTHTVSSVDPNYNQISVAAVTTQIRDNDFGITGVDLVLGSAARRRVTRQEVVGLALTTTGVVNPAAAESLNNYRLVIPGSRPSRDRVVPIEQISFNVITEVATLLTTRPLREGTFFQLTVRNISAPGDSFVLNVGFGTQLSYTDSSGDAVALKLKNDGRIVVTTLQTATPEKQLRLVGTNQNSLLSGTVKKPKRGNSDGQTTIDTMTVSNGSKFRSTLRNPPFRIGPMSQAAVDELLAASGGTLAGVLIVE
jgi:Ca2+-binding RTX toxin-like protein